MQSTTVQISRNDLKALHIINLGEDRVSGWGGRGVPGQDVAVVIIVSKLLQQ